MLVHKRLSDVADVIAGQSPPSSTYNKEGVGLPFYQGKADFGVRSPITRTWCSVPNKTAEPGDILMSVRAPIGPVNMCVERSAIGRGIAAIRAKEGYSNEYLFAFLKRQEKSLAALGTGSTFTAISTTQLRAFKVPVVGDENDQRRIAALLSRAEGLIAQRKESLRLLDELVRSVFLEMFGDPGKNEKQWPVRHLEDMTSDIVDCPHSTPEISEGPTPFACIRTSELRNGYIFWPSMRYVDEDIYKVRTKRLVPQRGDIIYGREGSFGEAVRLPFSPKFCLGQRTMLIRPDRKVCSGTYLWAALRSEYGYHQALRKNSGSTVGHVNVKDIRKFKFPCPPVTNQRHFSSIVQSIDNLREKLAESQLELEQLYGSLSQRAFRGELHSPTLVGGPRTPREHYHSQMAAIEQAALDEWFREEFGKPPEVSTASEAGQQAKPSRKSLLPGALKAPLLGEVVGEQFKPEFTREVIKKARLKDFTFSQFAQAVTDLKFKYAYSDLVRGIFDGLWGAGRFLEQRFEGAEQNEGDGVKVVQMRLRLLPN